VLIKAAPEYLETGIVCSVKKNYGHITCLDREEDMFFSLHGS